MTGVFLLDVGGSGLAGLVWYFDWFCAALWHVVRQTVGACPLGGVVPD